MSGVPITRHTFFVSTNIQMWIAYNLVSLKAALLDAAARATACTVIAIVVRSLIGWDSLSHYMAEGAYEPAD